MLGRFVVVLGFVCIRDGIRALACKRQSDVFRLVFWRGDVVPCVLRPYIGVVSQKSAESGTVVGGAKRRKEGDS